MNKYYCSDGSAVSQSTIDRRRSEAYREYYGGEAHPTCKGCGNRAEGTAHILSQARCKILGMTELIWSPANWFPACHRCNSLWESNYPILNWGECMEYLRTVDEEGYNKRLNLVK